MASKGLVFGLLDNSAHLCHPALAAKLRSFTLSWTRYGYHGTVLEGASVDDILARAADAGYRYCLIQAYGHVILEPWTSPSWDSKDFHEALATWIETHDFFVMGRLTVSSEGVSSLDDSCLLVNLKYYEQFGRPVYHRPCEIPAAGSAAPGWNLVNASLEHRKPVHPFPIEVAEKTLDLSPQNAKQAFQFAEYLDGSVDLLHRSSVEDRLTTHQLRFLTNIRKQTDQARRGVFLWNVESYRDIAETPPGFSGPITSLYSVAAGFKPNMILHTHSFSRQTRVVYFDYSRKALELKKVLCEEWDGEDFPHFLKYIMRRFPPPDTFYQLWNDLAPEHLRRADIERVWEGEIRRWGGTAVFKDHWKEYRVLPHEYIHCDVLAAKEALLERVRGGPGEVVWWSNAFFTVLSNWFHTPEQRRDIYAAWVRAVVAKNPQLYLYGFDHNNVGVNGVSAQEYSQLFFQHGGDCLTPNKPFRIQIRS